MSRKKISKLRDDKVSVEVGEVKLSASGTGVYVLPVVLIIVLAIMLTVTLTAPSLIDHAIDAGIVKTSSAVLERPPA